MMAQRQEWPYALDATTIWGEKPVFILSMAAALATAAPIAPSDGDARCTAVLALLVSQSKDDMQKGAINGLLYFIGKLKGRDPSVNIETLMRAVYNGDAKILEKDQDRCLGEMRQVGEEMSKAGAAMQANP